MSIINILMPTIRASCRLRVSMLISFVCVWGTKYAEEEKGIEEEGGIKEECGGKEETTVGGEFMKVVIVIVVTGRNRVVRVVVAGIEGTTWLGGREIEEWIVWGGFLLKRW